MAREMTGLKFYFRNGETWTIDRRFIGDLWIKHITTSFGRIHGSEFVEIHPCEGFKIEIFQEGDHVQTHDINLGGLELGMFSRALKYEDIERMEILYKNGTPDLVYFLTKIKQMRAWITSINLQKSAKKLKTYTLLSTQHKQLMMYTLKN